MTNKTYWSWASEPFGTTAANDDVDGDGNRFAYNLRFPGQYFDSETGLHYNATRDYDPEIGRYIQSDSYGLQGGLNTYLYASASPLMRIDPKGTIDFEPPIDSNNPKLDPNNPPQPKPPGGIPQKPVPAPVQNPARTKDCNAQFKMCMSLCTPRCPGPVAVKVGVCGAACTSYYLLCVFKDKNGGGGEE